MRSMVEGHRPASTAFDIMCPSTTLRVVPLPVPGRIFLAESIMRAPLPIGRVGGKIRRDRAFPFVAIGEKLGLVIEQLLARFGREFEVRPLDHRIDRACFLAEAAIEDRKSTSLNSSH